MPWMPGASRAQTFSGNRHRAKISKIVLHTTEGSSWPGYGGGGSAPHFTVHRDGTIRQHISTGYASKALVNRPGGVQTNNAGVIQIEYIGSCDRAYASKHGLFFTEDASDQDLAGLARVLAWIHETHGVPLTAHGLSWPTSNAAYRTAPQRMSYSKWNSYRGVCGHTHVPENDHWDPGAFPVARLLALAGAGPSIPSGGTSVPVPAPPALTTDGKLTEDGRQGRESSKALQRFLNSRIKARTLKIDGRLGPKTYLSLQEYLEAPYRDGKISRQSYKPVELGNGIGPHGWDYTGRGSKGSQTVELLQAWVGVKQDGIWYEGTTAALQSKLNDHAVGM